MSKRELGDGEPSPVPSPSKIAALVVEAICLLVRDCECRFCLHECIECENCPECQIAMREATNDVLMTNWRYGAAQEVSPPSPEPCLDCAANDRDWVQIAQELGCEATREEMLKTIRKFGDTRELKAALSYEQGQLDQFLRMKKERPIDPIYWDMHEENRLRAAVEGL